MPPPLRDPIQDLFSQFLDRVAIPAAERLIDRLTSPPPTPRTPRRPKPPKPRLRPGKQAPKRSNRTSSPGTLPGKLGLYDVLEVSPRASGETIRAAYLSLSKRFHPDTHPGDKKAEKRMKEINEAWEVLGDKKKRERYDKYGVFR